MKGCDYINSLSVCIICKNEEFSIRQCLDSVVDIADEIIIVDTGSTDATLNIANQYTSNIYTYNWNNNFSDARNFSLSKATKDWILVIDCDEQLLPITKNKLSILLSDTHVNAYCINILLPIDECFEKIPMCRLFRNNNGYKYKNKLHEQIIHCINPSTIKDCHMSILHLGYNSDVLIQKDKLNRNINILQEYTDDEKDCFYYYHLGNMYLYQQQYQLSIDSYLKALSIYFDPYGFSESLLTNLCKSYYLNKQYDQVLIMNDSFHYVFSKYIHISNIIEDSKLKLK